MTNDELTVMVNPTTEPRVYPVWEFDPPRSVAKITQKRGEWCWTACTTGLPTDLQNKFDTFGVEGLCHIIAANPAYFFYCADKDQIIWEYPLNQDKEGPKFSGADALRNIHIAEIKWHEKWNICERIEQLANSYAKKYVESKLGFGKSYDIKLTFHIAFPGEISRQCITDIVSPEGLLHQQLIKTWKEVHTRFGLIQLGWKATNLKAYLLRVYWFDGTDWDNTRQDFRSRNAQLVPLSWYP